jgi:curved DNA-binding protein
MDFIDYYKVLGIHRTASSEDIKKAYYKFALKYHPDRNIDDELSLKKFLLVQKAYKILSNIDSRIEYSIELEQNDIIKLKAKTELKKRKEKFSE